MSSFIGLDDAAICRPDAAADYCNVVEAKLHAINEPR